MNEVEKRAERLLKLLRKINEMEVRNVVDFLRSEMG